MDNDINFIEELKKMDFNVDSEFFRENHEKLDDLHMNDDMLYEHKYFEKMYFINKGHSTKFGNIKCKDDNLEYSIGKVSLRYVLKSLNLFLCDDDYMPLLFDYFCTVGLKLNSEYLNDKSQEGIKNIFKVGLKDIISEEIRNMGLTKVFIEFQNMRSKKLKNDNVDLDKDSSLKINTKNSEKSQSKHFNDFNIEKMKNLSINEENIDEDLPLKNIGELFDVVTVKINSKNNISLKSFESLSDSFIYFLSYNFSYSLVEIKSKKISEIKNLDCINRVDESQDKKIIPTPKKSYNKKLIHYFQQALSTEDPLLKFLSYYQCLEYFYLKIYKNKMIKKVKDTLSSPNSINSYDDYSDDEIDNIIDYIQKEERHYKEEQSLIKVLDEFLDKSKLVSDLQNYWGSDFNLIFNNKVEFAEAPSLNNVQPISTKTLASRIYKIRNSLVHSKEGKDNAYEPFNKNHEKELKQELLLIRLVAEQIIEGSSEEIRKNEMIISNLSEPANNEPMKD